MASKPKADSQQDSAGDGHAPDSPPRGRFASILRILKKPYVIGIVVGLGVAAGTAKYFLREPEISPAERLEQALHYVDDGRDDAARKLAAQLQDQGYQDPDFPGAVAYVLGLTSFREAEELEDPEREHRFVSCLALLQEAERLSLPLERRPEWAYATGICLYRLGQTQEAIAPLAEAIATYPAQKIAASLMLSEIYIDSQEPENLELGLKVNEEVLADATISRDDRDRAQLQRAQMLLGLGRKSESAEALSKVSPQSVRSPGIGILRAQTAMSDGRLLEAIRLLEPIAAVGGLENMYPSQASYLIGVCWDRLDELENAVASYQRTAERYSDTHESLAARLNSAESLRKLGRSEESLEQFGRVLRSIVRPESFRNRWVKLERLREVIIGAWNGWMDENHFDEAITLAEMMPPAIPREQAYELVAQANLRWAEHVDAETARLPADARDSKLESLWLRRTRAGLAYYRLAQVQSSAPQRMQSLWLSADNYFRGHEYEAAAERLSEIIDSRSSNLHVPALVRRRQCQLNMDRLDFQAVIAASPTDSAAFQARYLSGTCYLERNETERAEQAWRELLDSPDLTPEAQEWRQALYSLGKLLFDTAELLRRKEAAQRAAGTVSSDHASLAQSRFDEANLRLEEFRDRYPDAPEISEVRFLLARSLQRSAEFPAERLRTSETENARVEYRRQMREKIDRAIREFQNLQMTLLSRLSEGTLDRLGKSMLRNCYFEIAQCYFSLERYEEAIAAYTAGAGRSKSDIDSLTAYVQIANCYGRLQKPAEAVSTLAQAQLILKQLPESAFEAGQAGLSRNEWQRWLDWAMKQHN
jgi:tetratricopeptide (TPR) repeat protein